MGLEAITLLRAALPRGYESLLPPNLDPVAKRIARKQRLSRVALVILSAGKHRPTPQEALGMLYFAQFVKTSDDALDRNHRSFDNLIRLREYIMQSEPPGVFGIKSDEILRRCLGCYPSAQQEVIKSFVDRMIEVHIDNPQRGIPGEYSFEDVMEYRRATNDPLVHTLANLTDGNASRFVSIGEAWQLVEDGLDWAEDAKEQTKNSFIGMATDAWKERGFAEGEELDYLLKALTHWQRGRIFDFRVNELLGTKNPHLKTTRQRYKQQILERMPAVGGNFSKFMRIVAQLIY